MEELSVFLWIGAIVGVIAQYRLKAPPVYFITLIMGIGGLLQTFNEYDNGILDGTQGALFSIVMLIAMLYSILNYNSYLMSKKGGN